MPITHPFVSAKTDPVDTTLVRPSNWNADHTAPPFAFPLIGGKVTLTPPVAATEVDATAYRTRVDLTNVETAHIVASVVTAASAGTQLALQYSTDGVAWSAFASPIEVAVDVASVIASSVVDLPVPTVGDVWLRLVTAGGDNTTQMVLGIVSLQEGGEVIAPPPQQGASDDFTDTIGTDLSAHTATGGGTWAYQGGGSGGFTYLITDAGRVRSNGSGAIFRLAYHSATPPSADYDVVATVRVVTDNNQCTIGVAGRMTTGDYTGYLVRYQSQNNKWELYRVVVGAFVLLGTYAQSYASGATPSVTLRMRGTAISALIDGVEQITAVDSAITAAGKAGIFGSFGVSNGSGLHLDDWRLNLP